MSAEYNPEFHTVKDLLSPTGEMYTIVLAAFEGWNDAGGAASEALQYLTRLWDFTPHSGIDDEDYFLYMHQRPVMMSQEEGGAEILWPEISVQLTELPDHNVRIAVVTGPEPTHKWKGFVRDFYELTEQLGAGAVILLGGLLAETPHTRPFPVDVTSESILMRQLDDVHPNTYTGSTGITGVLAVMGTQYGIPATSLWVSIPHYVGQPPHPKATLALLKKLETLVGIAIPLKPLEEEVDAWERGAAELLEDERELAQYVAQLESTYDMENDPQTSGDDIAAEFEQFLKRREQ